MAVRLTDKTVMIRTIEDGADAKRVTFAQPFPRPQTLKEGCLAVAGSSREIYRRMIVSDIKSINGDQRKTRDRVVFSSRDNILVKHGHVIGLIPENMLERGPSAASTISRCLILGSS